MNYQYRCVSFSPELKGGLLGVKGVPLDSQLNAFIEANTSDGWEFYSIGTIHTPIRPGCLASLFGKREEIAYQDIAVFRKPK